VNKKLSYWDICAVILLTLPTAIQQVGMAASVYCVDCGNVAKTSFCD